MKFNKIYKAFHFLSIFLILFITSCTVHTNTESISKQIEKFNSQEKNDLTSLFKVCFFSSAFGYTIFGDKPMSIEVVYLEGSRPSIDDLSYTDIEYVWGRYRMKEGWDVWIKYFKSIPLKGFSLISYPGRIEPKTLEIAIINHEKFLKIVEEHLDEFQNILNCEIEPAEILKEYVKGRGYVFESIQNHDGLLGILLGYGKGNAWQFMNKTPDKTLTPFTDFSKLNFKDMKQILPPLFVAIESSEETEKLKIAYAKQREEIDKIYQKENFLEYVLQRLID